MILSWPIWLDAFLLFFPIEELLKTKESNEWLDFMIYLVEQPPYPSLSLGSKAAYFFLIVSSTFLTNVSVPENMPAMLFTVVAGLSRISSIFSKLAALEARFFNFSGSAFVFDMTSSRKGSSSGSNWFTFVLDNMFENKLGGGMFESALDSVSWVNVPKTLVDELTSFGADKTEFSWLFSCR